MNWLAKLLNMIFQHDVCIIQEKVTFIFRQHKAKEALSLHFSFEASFTTALHSGKTFLRYMENQDFFGVNFF